MRKQINSKLNTENSHSTNYLRIFSPPTGFLILIFKKIEMLLIFIYLLFRMGVKHGIR